MALYDYLALEGGGAKGYIDVGVAEELERLGVLKDFRAIAGTSVGAIAALVLSTGWPVEKMKQTFLSLDFGKMAQGDWKDTLKIPYTIKTGFGLHDGAAFLALFKSIVKEVTGNENTTFEEWHKIKEEHPELGLKDIFVEACNCNRRVNETFSYLSQHKDVPIADAIRASMAFPGYFTRHVIKGKSYSDGGVQMNCPSAVFEEEPGVFNPKVLTVRLDSKDEIKYFEEGIEPPEKEINCTLDYAVANFEASTNAQNFAFHRSPYKEHTIFCDTLDVGTLDFELKPKKKDALIASGQYSTMRYFQENHPELAKQVYGKEDKATLKQIKASKYTRFLSDFIAQQPAQSFEGTATVDVSSLASSSNVVPITHRYSQWCQLPALQKMHRKAHTVDLTLDKEKKKTALKV
ncbi:MAG: hypothetical protein BGO43_05160 [Gammaproteobacteria bacterium 39-13]|nr:patatin-like phospholipase family protein [Gammaproteobacteria bacterium]OJV96238.1 MAG: hypothetical protein BGO43_05160 [Gammaproteobacteria bacterium 39-13]